MGTPLQPPRDHRISLPDAAAMTRRYRETHPDEPGSGAFLSGPVMDLLKQPGCVAVRIYRATNDKNEPAFVLVGVDANGNDLVTGTLLEICYPCPPYCPDDNALKG